MPPSQHRNFNLALHQLRIEAAGLGSLITNHKELNAPITNHNSAALVELMQYTIAMSGLKIIDCSNMCKTKSTVENTILVLKSQFTQYPFTRICLVRNQFQVVQYLSRMDH